MEDLDELIKEALGVELRNRRGQGSVRRLRTIGQIVRSSYADPDNWELRRHVVLLHNDPAVGSLGCFAEYRHKGSNARKLVHLPLEPTGYYEVEIVSGPIWAGPHVHKLRTELTAGELAHIRAAWQPRVWKPAWKHLKGRRKVVTQQRADELLKEIFA